MVGVADIQQQLATARLLGDADDALRLGQETLEILEATRGQPLLRAEAIHEGNHVARQLEALDDAAKEQIVDAINHYPSQAENGVSSAEFALTAQIPVSWSWRPRGLLPSYVGTTYSCGADQDLRVRFSNVSDAYSNPGSLRLTTNSVYVWGIMAFHRYRLLAYNITRTNTVDICIGVKRALGVPVISSAIKGMFWIGLWID